MRLPTAAILLAITISGLLFAKQALKLAAYALVPFGRILVPSPTKMAGAALAPFGKQILPGMSSVASSQ